MPEDKKKPDEEPKFDRLERIRRDDDLLTELIPPEPFDRLEPLDPWDEKADEETDKGGG